MKCLICGAELPDGAAFCVMCGQKVVDLVEVDSDINEINFEMENEIEPISEKHEIEPLVDEVVEIDTIASEQQCDLVEEDMYFEYEMDMERVLSDYQKINSILPRKLITAIMNTKSTDNVKKYKKAHLIQYRPGWLKRLFIRFLLPFRFRASKKDRLDVRLGLPNLIYVACMWWGYLFVSCYSEDVLPVFWTVFLFVALLPQILALFYLLSNKHIYKKLED